MPGSSAWGVYFAVDFVSYHLMYTARCVNPWWNVVYAVIGFEHSRINLHALLDASVALVGGPMAVLATAALPTIIAGYFTGSPQSQNSIGALHGAAPLDFAEW